MSAPVEFQTADPFFPETEDGQNRHLRQLAGVARGIMDGKINAAQDFSLDVSPAVQTVVTDSRVANTSRIVLTGGDDAGIAHLASGTVRVLSGSITTGSFTVAHVPSPVARSFRASILS